MAWLGAGLLIAALSTAAAEDREPGGDAPNQAMVGHFEAASFAMLSVAVGDLREARRHARLLAESGTTPQVIRTAAEGLTGCRDVECGGPAAAALARSCSGCHVETGDGPRPGPLDRMPKLPREQQHAYAAMFMWVGLVTPHDEAFRVGLDGIRPPADLDSADDIYDQLQSFETLLEQARPADDWDERADHFGQLLLTCHACHDQAGIARQIKRENRRAVRGRPPRR